MKKRIISLLLVLTFMLSIVPSFGITASATSGVVSAESEAVIMVEEIWGNPGKTVDLNLVILENPGILGATITVSWDENLTLVADASGEAFNHMTYTSPSRYVASGTNFVWFGNEVEEAIDGAILTLTFKVSETAQNNDILPVRVSYTYGDIIDQNDNDVTLNITDGHIRVITYQPGDVTGDGRVTARDLVRLSQYISDGCKTDPEGYNAEVVEGACDVTGDGRINARDLIKLSQYISDGSQTNPEGYNAVLKPAKIPECQHSNAQETPATAAKCTEPGNIAYWYCADCGKYYRDADCTAEISFSNTVVEATGHTYSQEWTNDTTYHWHKATCEHNDLISEKILHSLDANENCSVCGYETITFVQLDTPVISYIEYDTIYWNPVEGAEYYTVRVNDNYECTLRGTECDLTDVKNNGSSISKFGYVRVEVRANGYTSEDGDTVYKASMWSDIDSSYYYVPETISSNAEIATRFKIGYGYNLVESPYLDTKNYASTNSVLNINKLLTIGEYSEAQGTAGVSSGEYYSSIDDFLSKTDISGKFGNEKSSQLIGSLKFQIEAGLDVEYSKHKYNSTYIGSSNVVYNDRRIINFEKENLKYCLSDIFLKDIRRESAATRGMSDEQLMEYLYTTYGTHAILGVNTGGSYVVQYTIATNSEKIAHDVKVGFELSTGGGAVDQIIQKNFNLSAAVEESIQSNESETKVSFVTYFYGGNGSTTTDIKEYNATKSTWEVNESNASAIGLTQDGAIAISSLISFIDYDLAVMFEEYIDERSDEMYDELYAQYTMPADLNWDVTTENGENILRIDLSAYQKSGSMKNVYSSYVIDNIMTVYPVMAGKDVHKIVIVGAFDEAESRNLIDKFSITLSKKWNRNVDIVIENLGVIAASDAGIVDTSAIRNNIKVNVNYSGINIIKQTNDEYQLFANINSKDYSVVFNTQDTTDIDLSSARTEAGELYLPQSFKANYEFGGWYDANGLQVADSMGKINLAYADTFNEVRVNAKWNPITYKITLNNNSATSAGTKEIFELYNVGFYLDYEGTKNIVKIPELPQRTGFVFKGYYAGVTDNATANAKPNGTQYIDESGNILVTWAEFSSNTVIYALWKPDVYTITLDNQGAKTSGSTAYYEKYVSGVYLDEACATTGKIIVPTKDGYTFMGYYESVTDNGTAAAKGTGQMIKPDGTIIASNTQYTANKTLYALWTEPRYEISFDNQGANVSGSTSIYQKTGVGFYQDVNCTTVVPSNKIAVPKKTGYTFGGYYGAFSNNNTPSPTGTTQYVKADGTILVSNAAFAGNKTLYALWDLDEFKVTWNTIANCSITVTRKSSQWSGAKIGALSSGDTIYYGDKLVVTYVANTGYHFEVNGSNPTSITNEFVVTKALTANEIAAKPIINTYTVVYNGNGNSGGSMSSVVHTYGTAKNLTTNSFTRHGWTFTGWKDQNGKTYTDGQQVNNLTAKHGDSITLYAQWKILTSKTYSLGGDSFDIGVTNQSFGYGDKLGNYFNISDLINEGYSKVEVTFTYNIKVNGDHFKTDSNGWYGYMMSNGIINNVDRMFYEAGTVNMDHDAYRSFSYSGTTNTTNLSNDSDYIGITIWIHPWGGLDFLNKGSISDVTIYVNFVKQY